MGQEMTDASGPPATKDVGKTGTVQISEGELYALRRVAMLDEVKTDLLSWVRSRLSIVASIVAIMVTILGVFGVNALIDSTIRSVTETAVQEVREKMEEELKKVEKQAKKAEEQANAATSALESTKILLERMRQQEQEVREIASKASTIFGELEAPTRISGTSSPQQRRKP